MTDFRITFGKEDNASPRRLTLWDLPTNTCFTTDDAPECLKVIVEECGAFVKWRTFVNQDTPVIRVEMEEALKTFWTMGWVTTIPTLGVKHA